MTDYHVHDPLGMVLEREKTRYTAVPQERLDFANFAPECPRREGVAFLTRHQLDDLRYYERTAERRRRGMPIGDIRVDDI